MRLQLIVAAGAAGAVVATASSGARGDPDRDRRASGSVHVYGDDDGMTVVSPAATAQAPVTSQLLVDTAVDIDIVTGASVDVLTSASPKPIHERRLDAAVGASWAATRAWSFGARTIASHEHDYDAVHVAASGQVELAQRNTTLQLALDGGWERASSVTDPTFQADRRTQRAIASVTQVLGIRTYADLIVDVTRASGYHASPYRTVPIIDPDSPVVVRLPEVTPTLRRAAAAALRIRRAIGARTALHTSYRLYADDWSIVSHTVSVAALTEAPDHRWRAGAVVRGYTQTAADFERTRYVLTNGMAPALRTRDRTLTAMRSLEATLTTDLALSPNADDGVRLLAELGVLRCWFDTAAQHERLALIASLGITTPF